MSNKNNYLSSNDERKGEMNIMTKFDLVILNVLNDNNIEIPSKALCVSQILALMEEKDRKSYSTVYRHLCNLERLGYVKCGLIDGLASTYFIADSGKLFCKSHCK